MRLCSIAAFAPRTSRSTCSRSFMGGETGFPPRERAEGERRSRRLADVLDVDVHRRDPQAGQPLDLVLDLRANRGRDLGEVQAVLDDDAQVELDPFAVRG